MPSRIGCASWRYSATRPIVRAPPGARGRRAACSAARARISAASTRVGPCSSSTVSPATSTRTGRTPVVYARCHGSIGVVRPRDPIVVRLGHEVGAGREPRPHGVGRGRSRRRRAASANASRNSSSMSAPMPSVPSATPREARRPPVADRVVEVGARVVHDRARQRAVEMHRVGEDPRGRRPGPRGAPRPPTSTGSSATWTCTPTPRSAASPHTASSVSSESVNEACAPTRPRPPDRRNRSFSASPALAPSAPLRSVTS